MQLRYIGAHPITFADPRVGEVMPDQEFEVPDELADAFTTRADVERLEAIPPSRVRKTKAAAGLPTDDTTALTTEEASYGVPDDH